MLKKSMLVGLFKCNINKIIIDFNKLYYKDKIKFIKYLTIINEKWLIIILVCSMIDSFPNNINEYIHDLKKLINTKYDALSILYYYKIIKIKMKDEVNQIIIDKLHKKPKTVNTRLFLKYINNRKPIYNLEQKKIALMDNSERRLFINNNLDNLKFNTLISSIYYINSENAYKFYDILNKNTDKITFDIYLKMINEILFSSKVNYAIISCLILFIKNNYNKDFIKKYSFNAFKIPDLKTHSSIFSKNILIILLFTNPNLISWEFLSNFYNKKIIEYPDFLSKKPKILIAKNEEMNEEKPTILYTKNIAGFNQIRCNLFGYYGNYNVKETIKLILFYK